MSQVVQSGFRPTDRLSMEQSRAKVSLISVYTTCGPVLVD